METENVRFFHQLEKKKENAEKYFPPQNSYSKNYKCRFCLRGGHRLSSTCTRAESTSWCLTAPAETGSANHFLMASLCSGFGEWEKTNSQSWRLKRNTVQPWELGEGRESWIVLLCVLGEVVWAFSSCGAKMLTGEQLWKKGAETMAKSVVLSHVSFVPYGALCGVWGLSVTSGRNVATGI